MTKTPHGKLRTEICQYLTSIGAWWFCTNSQGYGRKGIPDVIACWRGKFIAIEVKAGRDTPTKWQERELMAVRSAMGTALVAYSLEEVTDVIPGFNYTQVVAKAEGVL